MYRKVYQTSQKVIKILKRANFPRQIRFDALANILSTLHVCRNNIIMYFKTEVPTQWTAPEHIISNLFVKERAGKSFMVLDGEIWMVRQ